jgi:nickel superoxide dismutase
MWTDCFKPSHFGSTHSCRRCSIKQPKAAGGSGVEVSADPKNGEELLDYIAQIDMIPWETKEAA